MHEIIKLGEKPPEFLQLHASLPGGGTGMVPLLEDGERVVIESEAIVRYIALEGSLQSDAAQLLPVEG